MPKERYSFVTVLHNLEIDKPIGANWKILGDLHITNSRTVANRIVTDGLRKRIGDLEVNDIISGKPFVFAITEYPFEDSSQEKQLALLYSHLVHVRTFTNTLWLIKDSSVDLQLGFLQHPYSIRPIFTRVSSNYLSSSFTTATGDRQTAVFTTEELAAAIEVFTTMYGEGLSEFVDPDSPLSPIGDIDRLSRMLYFVQGARSMFSLPDKISYYCTCLEALVSTSSNELSHQVSERVATLIGDNPAESLEVYRNLKRAYDTRSQAGTRRQAGWTSRTVYYRITQLRQLFAKIVLGNSVKRGHFEEHQPEPRKG